MLGEKTMKPGKKKKMRTERSLLTPKSQSGPSLFTEHQVGY